MSVFRVREPGNANRCVALGIFADMRGLAAGAPVLDSNGRLVGVIGNCYPPHDQPILGKDVAVAVDSFAEAMKYTPAQIEAKYGDAVVDISGRVRKVVDNEVTWGRIHQVGVVVSKGGLIYTSDEGFSRWPVFARPPVVRVGIHERDGRYRTVPGEVLDVDSNGDIGVVRVDPSKVQLTPIPAGDSELVKKGEPVVVVGREGGDLSTVTTSVAKTESGTDPVKSQASTDSKTLRVLAMVTTAHPQGPVGGGVIDLSGHLVGVMTNSYRSDRPVRGDLVGPTVAVASACFRRRVVSFRQLEANAWFNVILGIDAVDFNTPARAASFGYPVDKGIVVGDVLPGSPAAKAGLRTATRVATYAGGKVTWLTADGDVAFPDGDIMLAMDGHPVNSEKDVDKVRKRVKPGDVVTLSIIRGRKSMELKVRAAPRWPSKVWVW